MENWKDRTRLLLGDERVKQLAKSHVIIVGIGGVGGITAEMLCRAGVGEMTIVDKDLVTESNINRQIVATSSTVGKQKTEALAERLLDINPVLKLHTLEECIEVENISSFFQERHYDVVVDAIDTIAPKVALLTYCLTHKIKIVSSMGAGGKHDPTLVEIADITKTSYCPLARIIRKRLAQQGIQQEFKVVFSKEPSDKKSVKIIDEKHKKSTTGTISYMPSIFGLYLSYLSVQELIG